MNYEQIKSKLIKYVEIIKKSKNIKPLSNFDIENSIKRKDFRGCFMKDELPNKPNKNECGVLNLQNSDQKGSHWVCWIKNDNYKIYFDSYGDANPPIELVKYLGENNMWLNEDRFQNYGDPPICGHLCLEFLKLN